MKLSEAVAGYVVHKKAMDMRFPCGSPHPSGVCRASGEVTMQEGTTGQVLAFLAGISPVTRFWERKLALPSGLTPPGVAFIAMVGFLLVMLARPVMSVSGTAVAARLTPIGEGAAIGLLSATGGLQSSAHSPVARLCMRLAMALHL